MEFVFQDGEGNNYDKIQIKNGFVFFCTDETINAVRQSRINEVKISYYKTHEIRDMPTYGAFPIVSKSLCSLQKCDYIKVMFDDKIQIHFSTKDQLRKTKFIDFILSITTEQLNKIDDIFDFLVGQKRFEENKNEL